MIQLSKIMYEQYPKSLVDSIRHKRADQQLAANENSEHDLMLQLLSGDMPFIDDIIRAGSAGIRAKDLHATNLRRGHVLHASNSFHETCRNSLFRCACCL